AAALLLLPAAASGVDAAPLNDDFAAATDLSVFDPAAGEIRGTNVAASKELGEPDHAGNAGGRSVWYTWTAPGDGSVPNVSFTTGFTELDTLLAVYTGAAVGALAEVASNDDTPGLGTGSAVSFATTPGTTYRIAVDGFGGKVGGFFLTWHSAPPNDNFADRIALAGASGSRPADDSSGATLEPGEDFLGQASVWYSWTPPADGTYKLSTVGSSFDTVLAVFTGTSIESLELVIANDDDPDRGCCSSWVPLVNADAATTYLIQVAALSEDGGPLKLSWGPLIFGTNGPDVLVGTASAEEIRGRRGNDDVRGGGGPDLIFGGRGNDVLRGGAGFDSIFDHAGVDALFGDGGRDTLDARDFRPRDTLVGGLGVDTCLADRGDVRRSC
ncbi:MAG: calcium-binding protein, partial [Nitriliruptorales bacterium]